MSEAITEADVAEAMQDAWDEFVADTGCIPDAFRIAGPRTTRVYANFGFGNFAGWVAARLRAQQPRVVSSPEKVEVIHHDEDVNEIGRTLVRRARPAEPLDREQTAPDKLEAALVEIGLMVCGDSDGRWIPRSGRVADVLEPLGLLPSHLARDPSSGT